MRLHILACAALALAGCATPKHNYVAPNEVFSRPAIGEIATVSVGEEMLSQGDIRYQEGIEVPPGTKIGGYTLHGGFYPQTGQDDESTYHSFLAGTAGTDTVGALSKNFFVDPPQAIEAFKDGSKLCVVTVFNIHSCKVRDFSRQEKAIVGMDSFQQTLLYSGRVGDKINISYREFAGSMARPAFSNDVEYDLNASDEIAYKGAKLRVIEATNSSITYELVRNFK